VCGCVKVYVADAALSLLSLFLSLWSVGVLHRLKPLEFGRELRYTPSERVEYWSSILLLVVPRHIHADPGFLSSSVSFYRCLVLSFCIHMCQYTHV